MLVLGNGMVNKWFVMTQTMAVKKNGLRFRKPFRTLSQTKTLLPVLFDIAVHFHQVDITWR